jgi:hypothetical protein
MKHPNAATRPTATPDSRSSGEKNDDVGFDSKFCALIPALQTRISELP